MPNFEGKPNFSEVGSLKEEVTEKEKDLESQQEKHPEIFARTFEDARRQEKRFSEEFIIKSLNDLYTIDYSVKSYFNNVAPDREELKILQSPQGVASLHEENSALIARNLDVLSRKDLGENVRKLLIDRRQKYIDKLQRDNATWADSLKNYYEGGEHIKNVVSGEYRGFIIPTKGGETIDLSNEKDSSKISGVRPNIKLQNQTFGSFIFWETSARSKEKLQGEKQRDQRRIYLNPKTENLAKTFERLMHTLNERDLSVQAKMFDRSFEFARKLRKSDPKNIRADSIVIYMPKDISNEVLGIVLSIYEESPDIFEDRPTPKVPARIAPGIAVGDEPLERGESLTSHRVNFIGNVLRKTKERMGLKGSDVVSKDRQEEAVRMFYQVLEELAKENNIDPNNFAFNT